jgi:hypothetical protein
MDDQFKSTLCDLRCSGVAEARQSVSQLLDALHL